MGLSLLWGGWIGHPSEEYRYSGDVLTRPSKGWRLITVLVDDDAFVDVMCPASGRSAIVVVPELLLEDHVLLLHVLLIFLELPL